MSVHFLVELTVRDGNLEPFEQLAQQMVAGSQQEPGTLRYEWYFSADRKRCRLLETYIDADATLAHFSGPVVQQLVPKLVTLATVERFQVFGDPGPQMRSNLAPFQAEVFTASHAITR